MHEVANASTMLLVPIMSQLPSSHPDTKLSTPGFILTTAPSTWILTPRDYSAQKLKYSGGTNLASYNPTMLSKQHMAYIKLKYDLLLKHNAFAQGNQLTHLGNRHQYAERLDNDVVAVSLAAEPKLKNYGAPA
jgi:hypothetical protein